MRRFVFSDGTSNKFWEIQVKGASTVVRYGRVGAAGRRQTKEFASPAAAAKAAESLIAEKLHRGYAEERLPSRVAPAAAPDKPGTAAKRAPATTAASAKAVTAAWRRIERWLKAHLPATYKNLRPPASQEELDNAEKKMGMRIPDPVRCWYQLHDGGTEVFENGWEWLPVSRMVNEWVSWRESIKHYVEECPVAVRGPVRPSYWELRWIPFSYDQSGSHDCIDLAPAEGGTQGQIIRVWMKEHERIFQAVSLAAWLEELAQGLESGRLVSHKEYKIITEAPKKGKAR